MQGAGLAEDANASRPLAATRTRCPSSLSRSLSDSRMSSSSSTTRMNSSGDTVVQLHYTVGGGSSRSDDRDAANGFEWQNRSVAKKPKPRPIRDVAAVLGKDERGLHILRCRAKDGAVEAGIVQPLVEGKPVTGELIPMRQREDVPFLFDVKTEWAQPDAPNPPIPRPAARLRWPPIRIGAAGMPCGAAARGPRARTEPAHLRGGGAAGAATPGAVNIG